MQSVVGAVALIVGLLLAAPAASSPDALFAVFDGERRGVCPDLLPSGDDTGARLALARTARCGLENGSPDLAVRAVARLRALQAARPIDLSPVDWLPEVEARVALHAGDPRAARDGLAALLASADTTPSSSGMRARWIYYLALACEAAGDPDGAAQGYARLLEEHPGSEYASRVQLHAPWPPLDAATALARAQRALASRQYEAAEQLLRVAVCADAACSPRGAATSRDGAVYEAAYQLGFLLYRYRRERVQHALMWFEALAVVPGRRRHDAAFFYGLAAARMFRRDEARRALGEFAAANPRDPRAPEARYLAAWQLVEGGRHRAALGALAERIWAQTDYAERARWWRGWVRREAGDCTGALQEWSTLDAAGPHAPRDDYWRAACMAELGRGEDAAALWSAVHGRAPFDYYGLLAARRLGLPLVADAALRADPDATWRGWSDASNPAVRAADLGLAAEARVFAAAGGEPITDAIALRAAIDRRAWHGWRADQARGWPSTPTTAEALRAWQLANPAFYRATIDEAAARVGMPASVVWAVAQTESAWSPRAVSVSDAMGLTQVVPQTALRIAAALGEHYVDGMLFEPHHAIRYGAWYLAALRADFGGQLPVAVAAYNAGPAAARTWLRSATPVPFDAWVESIAFDQAREYVRRVVVAAVRYEIAYGDVETLADPTLGGIVPLEVAPVDAGQVLF